MTRRTIVKHRTVEAPQAVVWGLLADAAGWKRWAGFTKASLEREGSPTPDGVGAIRNFGSGPVLSREEVTEFEAPHRLSYRLLSGLPVQNYHSTVEVTPLSDDSCEVRWASSFDDTGVKSAAMGWFIRATLSAMCTRLGRAAERNT